MNYEKGKLVYEVFMPSLPNPIEVIGSEFEANGGSLMVTLDGRPTGLFPGFLCIRAIRDHEIDEKCAQEGKE